MSDSLHPAGSPDYPAPWADLVTWAAGSLPLESRLVEAQEVQPLVEAYARLHARVAELESEQKVDQVEWRADLSDSRLECSVLHARVAQLETTGRALVEVIDRLRPKIDGAISLHSIRAGKDLWSPDDNWVAELSALRALLTTEEG